MQLCEFITHPNLPTGRVTLAVMQHTEAAVKTAESLGIKLLSPDPCPELPDEVASHSDMLMCHLGGRECFLAPGQVQLKEALQNEGFSICESDAPTGGYPNDIKLNVAISEDFAAGTFAHSDKTLKAALEKSEKKLIPVKQGYAKCSVCFITKDAYITEDPSIARALRTIGADVLEISQGDIYLSERHCGFLGGSSGKVASDLLAVTGSLGYHSDGERIRSFAAKHGVEIIELTDGRINDIGGILPLKQTGKG